MLTYLVIVYFAGVANAECHANWLHYDKFCFFFSTNSLSWFSAASSCREHGARLAEIETRSKGDFVRNMAIRLKSSYWLGGRDDEVEGHWEWSSGAPFTYTDWRAGQPDNYHDLEDCVGVHSGGWFDEPCDTVRPYLCEKEYPEDIIIG